MSGSNPGWMKRLNHMGRSMLSSAGDGSMAVPLDAGSLLEEARRNTNLSDFGPDDVWREGLEVLVTSLDREAKLTLIGRILCRADIVNALETRLRVEETYRQHPAILDEPVEAPPLHHWPAPVRALRSFTSSSRRIPTTEPPSRGKPATPALLPRKRASRAIRASNVARAM